jgi:hypothetical protein
MQASFEFKASPLGKLQRVHIDASSARILDANGMETARIRFADVDGGRFVSWGGRYGRSRRLDLSAGGELFRLGMNCTSDTSSAAPLSEFYAACEAILTALQRVKPSVVLEFGEGRRMRWLWFSMSLCALLLGIGLPILALAMDRPTKKILSGLLPAVILTAMGVAGCRIFRPWQAPPRVPIGVMLDTFREYRPQKAP